MSLEDLERRVAALEAAAASTQPPAPTPDDQRLTFLAIWLRGYIGSYPLTADGAESLACQLLTDRAVRALLAVASAPIEWPELPAIPPHPEGGGSSYILGYCQAWALARCTLAAMNPNRQEKRNDG